MARRKYLRPERQGFTLLELLVVVVVVGTLVLLALLVYARPRLSGNRIVDSSNMRSIVQGSILFSTDNDNRFPTPSIIDQRNATIDLGPDGDVGLKNTTGAIMSILIFQRIISPDILVGRVGRAGVRVMDDYTYDHPSGTIFARQAQWDPHFKGTPWDHLNEHSPKTMSQEMVSHNSYAHTPIGGARRDQWSSMVSSATPVVSQRGPVFEIPNDPVLRGGDWRLVEGATGTQSETLGFYGAGDRWSGHVGFGDASVRAYELPSHDGDVKYHIPEKDGLRAVVDNFFVDEPWEGDAEKRKNALLRTFWRGIPLDAPFDAAYLTETSKGLFIDGAEPPALPAVP